MLTLYPPREYRYFASASRATADRSRMSRRPSERPASTHTSLPDPRPKLPAMWPVRVTSLSHVNKVTGVVWLILARPNTVSLGCIQNKDILNRRLNRTIQSDHHHGPDTMSRCAYELVGSG